MEADKTIKKVTSWISLVAGLNSFIKQIWEYLALIFFGVIAGLVYGMKQIKSDQTNISTDTYIKSQSQDIKIKQKGEGNTMDASNLTGKEKRQARRDERKAKREKKNLNKIL